MAVPVLAGIALRIALAAKKVSKLRKEKKALIKAASKPKARKPMKELEAERRTPTEQSLMGVSKGRREKIPLSVRKTKGRTPETNVRKGNRRGPELVTGRAKKVKPRGK